MHQHESLFDGKYKILKTLGKGGTSTVFLAENVRLGTQWAIKEVPKQQGHAVQFLTEPHVLKNLRHSALPRIFDIIENEDYLYLVQDYIEGDSLETVIRRNGSVPERRLMDWAIEICDVYSYLHGQSPHPIIYRDMKPGNLIVDREGRIKLIDFGIAREFKEESAGDTVCLGTRGYAAPEQYGTSQTDPRSDIYSLGVTLYHALTGNNPNDPPYELAVLSETEGVWSLAFARIIDKAVRLDPEQRYQTAFEMKKALERVRNPVEMEPDIRNDFRYPQTGPILIGVGGVESRCGTTYHAVMLANHLARTRKKEVALVEYNSSPSLGALSPRLGNEPFEEGGVAYFPGRQFDGAEGLNFGQFRDYRYVVLDLGELKPIRNGIMTPGKAYYEMTRVHCPVLVASGAPWRLNRLLAFNYGQENLDDWNLLITPTSSGFFKQIGSAVSQYFNYKRLRLSNPEPDPFRIGKLQEEMLEKIIQEVVPARIKGLRGLFGNR